MSIAGITTDATGLHRRRCDRVDVLDDDVRVPGGRRTGSGMPGGIGPNPATIWPSMRHIV